MGWNKVVMEILCWFVCALTWLCEMKYFLPYQWARNVTVISDIWPPNVNGGSQKGTQYLWSSSCCHSHGDCWGTQKDARSSHLPQLPPFTVNNDFLVFQSCPTLCNSTDFSMPGSYAYGILQARIAIPFSRASSQPRDETQLSCIAGRFFTIWATREAHKQSRNRIWPQITEMHMKGMNLVSPEACIFPYIFVIQWLSLVLLFVIPWTVASQAPLSFTISRSLLKLMSIESVMPSNHLVLSSLSPPAFNLSEHQGLF